MGVFHVVPGNHSEVKPPVLQSRPAAHERSRRSAVHVHVRLPPVSLAYQSHASHHHKTWAWHIVWLITLLRSQRHGSSCPLTSFPDGGVCVLAWTVSPKQQPRLPGRARMSPRSNQISAVNNRRSLQSRKRVDLIYCDMWKLISEQTLLCRH